MVSKMKFLMLTAAFGVGSAVAAITSAVPDQDQESGCYLISNAEELYGFAAIVNEGLNTVAKDSTACGKLDADITVNENVLNDDGTLKGAPAESWTPMVGFAGNFDGQGHSISGLYVNSSESNVGFFGSVDTKFAISIQNLTLKDSYFAAATHVGGIVGRLKGDVTIENCINESTVMSSKTANQDSKIGGLVAYSDGSKTLTIINSSNAGRVTTGGKEVGGLVGSCQSACSISGSNNSGNLAGAEPIGGIVGYINAAKMTQITDSRNTGLINGGSGNAGEVIGGVNGTVNGENLGSATEKFPVSETTTDYPDGVISVQRGDAVVIGDRKNDVPIPDASIPYDVTNIKSVTFERTFVSDVPQTIVLPFDVPAGATMNAKFYSLDSVYQSGTTWKASFTNIAKYDPDVKPKANVPYVVFVNANQLQITYTGTVTLKKTVLEKDMTEKEDWWLAGTFEPKKWQAGDEELGIAYGFRQSNGKFGKVGAGASIDPMRAYLRKKDASVVLKKSLSGSLNQLPVEIEVDFVDTDNDVAVSGKLNTQTGEFSMDRWYDLNGRRLNHKPTVKGTYFKNNKKVIVK